jgi:putative membrane protein
METQRKPESPGSLVDADVYLAAERTFLSWIRTGLALAGFGIVAARYGRTTRFGVALVLLSVALTVGAIMRYIYLLRLLDRGEILRRPSRMAIALAAVLAALGCGATFYLLVTP